MNELHRRLLLLVVGSLIAADLCGCGSPPRTKSGQPLKLVSVTHDWQTVYFFRPVEDPKTSPTPAPRAAAERSVH